MTNRPDTPDTPERHDRHLSTLSNNGTQRDDAEQPRPELIPIFELVVVYPSGVAGDVFHYRSMDAAVAHAQRFQHSAWSIRRWLQTPPETVITWSRTRVSMEPAEAPDAALVRRVTMEPPETGQEPPDSPQTGQTAPTRPTMSEESNDPS